MARQPLGITFSAVPGKTTVGVYEDEAGVGVFETDDPYLLEDGVSLESPVPVFLADGSIYQDGNGDAQRAMGVSGLSPAPPINPGPLDVVLREMGAFTNFSQEFGLASNSAVVGLTCRYSGNPAVTITHGGEPITIIEQARSGGVLALIAAGFGLTTEVANLEISATGGTLDGGVLRINEMIDVDSSLSGWENSRTGTGAPIAPATMTGTAGGTVKGVFSNSGADRLHVTRVDGADNVFNGFIVAGPNISTDFSTAGNWNLGVGWSIDGDDFVHTGPASELSLSHEMTSSITSTQCYIEVSDAASAYVTVSRDKYGPGSIGYVSTALGGGTAVSRITASGDVRVSKLIITTSGISVSWAFFSTAAVDGKVLQPVMAYQPAWRFVAAEIMGQPYEDGA